MAFSTPSIPSSERSRPAWKTEATRVGADFFGSRNATFFESTLDVDEELARVDVRAVERDQALECYSEAEDETDQDRPHPDAALIETVDENVDDVATIVASGVQRFLRKQHQGREQGHVEGSSSEEMWVGDTKANLRGADCGK